MFTWIKYDNNESRPSAGSHLLGVRPTHGIEQLLPIFPLKSCLSARFADKVRISEFPKVLFFNLGSTDLSERKEIDPILTISKYGGISVDNLHLIEDSTSNHRTIWASAEWSRVSPKKKFTKIKKNRGYGFFYQNKWLS